MSTRADDFSKCSLSESDHEEEEYPSEEEYESSDDLLAQHNCLAECLNSTYSNFWKKDPHQTLPDNFAFRPNVGQTSAFQSEDSAFSAMISPAIIDLVVEYTNIFINREVFKLKNRQLNVPSHFYETDSTEIKALVGLWLKLGVTGYHNSCVAEIFSASKSSSLDAHLCFSRDLYRFLMKSIGFDDKNKRVKNDAGSYEDKLVHIRQIFRIFTRNTQQNYSPGEFLTIDEILLPFRGRCPFRMFIPSKKAKFGIKIFCAVDPATMYLVNSDIYLGKQGTEGERNLGKNVVLNLAEQFLSEGRISVTDNFFTSIQLGTELWGKKTRLLGTIRKNRVGNPSDFVKEPIEVGKSKFVFREHETLMMLQARPRKQVMLYSTKHHQPEVHKSGKPKMITDYNATKFAVDIFDEMYGRYTYSPRTNRWPLRIFMHLCDAAAQNANVLFNKEESRRSFIVQLANQLMHEQKERRSHESHWISEGFREIDSLYESLQAKMMGTEKAHPVNHCYICNLSGRGESIQDCSYCKKQICKNHITVLTLCPDCNIPEVKKRNKKEPTTAMNTRQTIQPNTCGLFFKCQKRIHTRCTVCSRPMCKSHRSDLNAEHCNECK